MLKSWYARYSSGLGVVAVTAAAFLFNPLPVIAQDDDDGPREPPPTRSSDVLSERVYRVISRVQELMNPEDDSEPQLEAAREELDDLNERYDSLNDFEKATLLNFYTNYYLAVDDIQSALDTFERILTIEDLRLEQRQRALMALGQIYAGEERYEESIDALNRWREISEQENETVFLLLANGHYNLDNYPQAIPYLLSHIEMLQDRDREIRRNIYSLLNLMYIEEERYEDAREVTETMIALYDNPADYRNLSAIYGYLEEDEKRIQAMELTYRQGHMDSEQQFMNLAQSLSGMDAPIRGIEVLEAGFEQGHVEENHENYRRLTQMYMMANEYDDAIEPAARSAELANEEEAGDAYDYLGYIYYMNREYQAAAEAMQTAIDRGNLDDPGDSYMFLARSLVELDRFDEAAEAANTALELGNSSAESYITFIENSQQRFETLRERREQASEYYRPAGSS